MNRSICLLFLLATTPPILAAEAPPVIRHEAVVTLDPVAHTVLVTDRLQRPAGLDSLLVDSGLTLVLEPGVAPAPDGTYSGETTTLVAAGEQPFFLAYAATAHQPTDQVRFSRENVGGEITATVGDEGIWLSGGTAWLPRAADALVAGRFEVITPAGWYPVLSGEVTAQDTVDGLLHTVYEITEPVDGLSLVANRFTVTERDHAGVTMRTCLLEDDPKLTELYLERTAHYLDLYSELIGPYPYRSFTTVENWFPTGYGMPGWTLLGSQVLRLPFIPYTSFGHEIAHNWWGNSVFVDPAEGNWCEGLTVWCADYLYKREESAAAAHQYRRNQLKDYAAYVGGHPERDFPLSTFLARHSGASRAVGYGKSMAIWHMLEQELGRPAVIEALRAVYRDFRGRPAAWSDFFAALETASGRDLETFAAQWLDRTGAPVLTISDVALDGDTVRFTLHQTVPTYDLRVPVVVTTRGDTVRTVVALRDREETVAIEAPGARSLAIDPDNDLFRLLDPAEIEPTLSQVLAAETHVFVPPAEGAFVRAATEAFARVFCECDQPDLRDDGLPTYGAVNVLVNPDPGVLAERQPDELRVHGDLVFLAGKRHSLKENDLVFAAPAPGGGTDLVILTRSAPRLEGLGSRLGHYGKYSWLLFAGSGRQVVKGNWTPQGSPLVADLTP